MRGGSQGISTHVIHGDTEQLIVISVMEGGGREMEIMKMTGMRVKCALIKHVIRNVEETTP